MLKPCPGGVDLLILRKLQLQILRSKLLNRLNRTVLAGSHLFQEEPVRAVIIQRRTGDV